MGAGHEPSRLWWVELGENTRALTFELREDRMKNVSPRSLLRILVVALSLAALGSTAVPDEEEKFFEGKVIEFYCPYSVGGGFDTYSRSIAKYLSKYLPARVVVVKNLTGAGGLVGTNQLWAAPGDGLTIGIVNGGGMIFNQVGGVKGVEYDLNKMTWLGRVVAEPHIMGVGAKTPFYAIDDLRQAGRTIVFSATGKGSDDYLGATVMAEALGFPLRQVVGFEGSAEANLSVVRGDVDGTEATLSTLLPLIESGDMRPILQIALERDSRLPGVPTALELVPQGKKDMVMALTSTFALGRAIAGPRGIPEDRVRLLREALDKVFHDEEFIQEMEKRGRRVIPLGGEVIAKLVEKVMANAGQIAPVLGQMPLKKDKS
jgi:tripartite-type tricarboxylate transporter receptor subunit TctC